MNLKKKINKSLIVGSLLMSGSANAYVLPTLDMANIVSMIEDAILQGSVIAENAMTAVNTYNRYETLVLQTKSIVQTGDYMAALNMFQTIVGDEAINKVLKDDLHLDASATLKLAKIAGRTFEYTPQTATGWASSFKKAGGVVNSSRQRRLKSEEKEFELYSDQMKVLSNLYTDGEKRKTSGKELGSKIQALGDSSELQTMQIIASQNQLRFSQQEATTEMLREIIKQQSNKDIMESGQRFAEREQHVAMLESKHNVSRSVGGTNSRKGFDSLIF